MLVRDEGRQLAMMEIMNLGWWFRAWFLKIFPSGSSGDANIENRFVDAVWERASGTHW